MAPPSRPAPLAVVAALAEAAVAAPAPVGVLAPSPVPALAPALAPRRGAPERSAFSAASARAGAPPRADPWDEWTALQQSSRRDPARGPASRRGGGGPSAAVLPRSSRSRRRCGGAPAAGPLVVALAALVPEPAVAVALQLAYQQRRRPGSGPPLVVALALAAALALALALRRQTPAILARPAQGRARAGAGAAAARPEPAQRAPPRQRVASRSACAVYRRVPSPARRCCRPCCGRLFRAGRASFGLFASCIGQRAPQPNAAVPRATSSVRAPGLRSGHSDQKAQLGCRFKAPAGQCVSAA